MSKDILTGLVLDDENLLSVAELSSACKEEDEWIILLVEEGILEPRDQAVTDWRFEGSSLTKARIVRRLQQQLGVNIAGAALVLELMDENNKLRSRLSILEWN